MIKNLPRELLWTDKKEISEMKSDKLRKQLYSVISMDQVCRSDYHIFHLTLITYENN